MHYQTGFGAGSPSLHANLFRYAMLHRLGGWWIDLDVVLLRTELPQQPIYFARENTEHIVNELYKFPHRHGLLAECVRRISRRYGETAT